MGNRNRRQSHVGNRIEGYAMSKASTRIGKRHFTFTVNGLHRRRQFIGMRCFFLHPHHAYRCITQLWKQILIDIFISISAIQPTQQYLAAFCIGNFIKYFQHIVTVGNRSIRLYQLPEPCPVFTLWTNNNTVLIEMRVFPNEISFHGNGTTLGQSGIVTDSPFGRGIGGNGDCIDGGNAKSVGKQNTKFIQCARVVHIVILHQSTVETKMQQ